VLLMYITLLSVTKNNKKQENYFVKGIFIIMINYCSGYFELVISRGHDLKEKQGDRRGFVFVSFPTLCQTTTDNNKPMNILTYIDDKMDQYLLFLNLCQL